MNRRVTLVTGANKGLGHGVAKQMALAGHKVYLGSRDAERGRQATEALASQGIDVQSLTIDVTDEGSVARAIAVIAEADGRLDSLVNNAGTHIDTATLSMTVEEAKMNYESDLWGTMRVLRAALPLLKASEAPRVVNITSTAASFGLTTEPGSMWAEIDSLLAYASTKAAINMMTVHYAFAFARDPDCAKIKINVVTPGYVASDLTGNVGAKTPDEGAQIVMKVATCGEDGPSGKFINEDGMVPW